MSDARSIVHEFSEGEGLDETETADALIEFLARKNLVTEVLSDICERLDDEGLSDELSEFLEEKQKP